MGGGDVVEMVEMVEMYLQNKYTKTPFFGSLYRMFKKSKKLCDTVILIMKEAKNPDSDFRW